MTTEISTSSSSSLLDPHADLFNVHAGCFMAHARTWHMVTIAACMHAHSDQATDNFRDTVLIFDGTEMPALRAFGRKWRIGSDDLVFPYVGSIILRFCW